MAYDYEKSKKLYESLTPEQQKKFAQDNTGQVQEFLSRYNAEKNQTANQTANTSKITNTPAATTTKQNTTTVAKPEYQGTGGATIQPKDRSWDTGNGQYTYNPKSGYYEMSGNQTSTPSSTNNKISVDSLRNTWDSYDYNKQQELLNKNPGLQDRLTKYGITNKQPGESGTVNTSAVQTNTPKTKNPDGTNWDYQDNSQERMDEIIGHLDDYTKTNPGLFSDYDTFYNAFIAGKGRTPEQEKVINDFFKKMKKYGDYDNKSSDEMGYLLAHGEPAEDYLSYLKYNDPQRYAEIQTARKEEETKISNDSYLKTVAESEGFDMSDSDFWNWNKEEMGYRDANKDGLDDRLYHEPTEEEKKLWEEDANYEAERLKIQNAYKNLQSDLTEQYPDADLSTIMVLTSDRGNKMLKALDTLSVSQTKVQGMIKYMQTERTNQDNAGQRTIAEIQKNLGMYYDYTPQGMSELAQAQYAATNVTLDQADNGTDTQKQMALDKVLSDYYDKYGSIIQRSKSQVINDVMALAKKKGISLSQALQENFINPLKQKPGYNQLNTIQKDPYTVKSGDITYRWDPETEEFIPIGGNGTYVGNGYGGASGVASFIDDLESKGYTIAGNGGSGGSKIRSGGCGTVVNDYLADLGENIKLTEANDIAPYATGKTPTEGAVAYFDGTQSRATPETKKHGHVGIVVSDNGDTITVLESNEGTGLRYNTYKQSDVTGYYTPNSVKTSTSNTANNQNSKYGNKSGWNPNGYSENLTQEYEAYLSDPNKEGHTDWEYKLGSFGISFEDFVEQAKNYARTGMKDKQVDSAQSALEAAVELYDYINGNKAYLDGGLFTVKNSPQAGWYNTLTSWLGVPGTRGNDAKNQFDTLQSRLTLDKLIETKEQGATYGSMTEGEWELLRSAASNLNWTSSPEIFQENLENLIWGLVRTVHGGGGSFPSNFKNSAASKFALEAAKSGRYDPYLKITTPTNNSNNSTNSGTPKRLS